MQYKVLIVRNRYADKLDFSVGLDWFKKNTPIEIVTEEIITNFDVTTEKISNATYSGVICGDDIYPKLRTIIPEGKYNAVAFIYGNDLDGIRVNVSKVLPLYLGTDLMQICSTNDRGKSLNHEIFHTFIHRLQRQQISIEDPMDTVVVDGKVMNYFNNDMLDAKPSNRTIAMQRIAPYWDKIVSIPTLNNQPKTNMQTYKYFNLKSDPLMVGVSPTLMSTLDKVRDMSGVPIAITSGLRTIEQNKVAGGEPNSSHLRGLAVDILCKDNFKRSKLVKAILNCGADVFLEDAISHLHIDIDSSIHALGQMIVAKDD